MSSERDWSRAPYDDRWTLASLLEQAAHRFASRPAVVELDGSTTTYGEIAVAAAALRGAIRAALPSGGRAVACLVTPGAPWFVAAHATFTSGLPYAALDPEAPDLRNRACMEECGADVLIADAASMPVAVRLAGGRVPVVEIESAVRAGASAPVVAGDPQDVCAYLFTSGSTGRPKTVVRSQRSFAHTAYVFTQTYGYCSDDLVLALGSPAHVGSVNEIVCCLVNGCAATPIGLAEFSVTRLGELLAARPMTLLALPPALLRPVLLRIAEHEIQTSVRLVLVSGAALRRADVGLFLDVLGDQAELWQNYGSTEAGPMLAASYRRRDVAGQGPLPLRIPAHGCTIEILDGQGCATSAGEVGSVIARSEYCADGYLCPSPEDLRRFERDERGATFRTGDRARRDQEGNVFLVGRDDRQVGLYGRRFDLGEVESAILADSAWRSAVAGVIESQGGRETLVAVVEPRAKSEADVSSLRTSMARLLPRPAIPQRLLVLDALPLTTTGKVDRGAAMALASERLVVDPAGEGGPPVGSLENWIADCWEHVLGISRPGRLDAFDELGGDSLAAIELLLVIESRFGVRFSIDRIAEAWTVADQARLATSADAHTASPVVSLRSDGEGPLVVLVPGIGGHAWVFAELARQLQRRCDVLALSMVDLTRQGRLRSHADVTDAVSERVAAEAGDRPLVLGGYSFGALIACELERSLRQRGMGADRLLLIDPLIRGGASMLNLARQRVASWRARLRTPKGKVPGSEASQALQRELAGVRTHLTRIYGAERTRLGSVHASLLLSRQGVGYLGRRPRLFGRELSTIERMELDCMHLDILRTPTVAATARWVDGAMSP